MPIFLILLALSTSVHGALNPITPQENAQVQATCGRFTNAPSNNANLRYGNAPWSLQTHYTDQYSGVVISPRHLLTWNIDVTASWTSASSGYKYQPVECNSFMPLKNNHPFHASFWNQNGQVWAAGAENVKMYYIGTCNFNSYPDGITLVEFPTNVFNDPVCLPWNWSMKPGSSSQAQSYNENGKGNRIFDVQASSCSSEKFCVNAGLFSRQDRGSPLVQQFHGHSFALGILGDVVYRRMEHHDQYNSLKPYLNIICYLSGVCASGSGK